MSPKEAALEQLLSERESQESFERAVIAARGLDVAEQVILEARFLYYVDLGEDAKIAELLPAFLERRETFKQEDSEIFGSSEDWLAVVEYVQAIAAMQKDDHVAFKKHITEAFWLSPSMGVVFAPHIERMRLREAMESIQLDFGKTFKNVLGKEQITLKQVLGKQSGLVIHFWSPWSRECETSLPDFLTTAEYLSSKNVGVVSILPETSDKVVEATREMLGDTAKEVQSNWIVDDVEASLSLSLQVQTVPIMVVIDKNGRILFNGHPADDNFWTSLKKLNSKIERPKTAE